MSLIDNIVEIQSFENILEEEEKLEENTAGSINESGFVNGLNRQGFIPSKCGSEKIANSIDAFARTVTFVLGPVIKLIDDGIGMTKPKMVNMFDANRENHCGDKSMGVSGIGGIISNFMLSKNDKGDPTTVLVYTKHTDGPYLKATIPWGEIYANKKYLGQIKIEPMNETEISVFNTDRNNFVNPTGTTFCFTYSEVFKNLLDEQFVPKQMNCSKMGTWWPVIFGKTHTQILLNKSDGLGLIALKKYDYFSGSDFDYYCGKFVWPIHYFKDNGKDRFVCLDPRNKEHFIEITHSKVGFSTKPKSITIDPRKLESAEQIIFTSGIRKDSRVFNPESENPQLPTATFYLNNYDSEYILEQRQKDILKKYLSETSLNRNKQRITGIPLKNYKHSNARADGESLVETILHRSEVEYETDSKQTNDIDIVHGIQQNKNANENEFADNYTRLIEYLKGYDCERNYNYFEKVISDNKKRKEEEAKRMKKEKDERDRKIAKELESLEIKKGKQIKETKANKEKMLAEILGTIELFIETEEQKTQRIQAEEMASMMEEERLQMEEEERIQREQEEQIQREADEKRKIQMEEEVRIQREADEKAATERKRVEDEKNMVESKEWEKKAAQLIIEHLAESNYNKKTGKEFYDYVMKYINNSNN